MSVKEAAKTRTFRTTVCPWTCPWRHRGWQLILYTSTVTLLHGWCRSISLLIKHVAHLRENVRILTYFMMVWLNVYGTAVVAAHPPVLVVVIVPSPCVADRGATRRLRGRRLLGLDDWSFVRGAWLITVSVVVDTIDWCHRQRGRERKKGI